MKFLSQYLINFSRGKSILDDAYEQKVSTCRILLETLGFKFQRHR